MPTMPDYNYAGVNRVGRKVQGRIEAGSEGELRMLLRGQGIRPTRISKSGVMNMDIGALLRGGEVGRISVPVLGLFTRQLHVLLGSGIPLVQALDILIEQTADAGLTKILKQVKERVQGGVYLWESLAAYPKSFARIYVAMLRAGEMSGALEVILDRLGKYLDAAHRLARQVKGAMVYPVIVLAVATGVIAILLTFVIPKFEEILSGTGQALPAPTQFLINLSHAVVNNIWMILAGLGAAAYAITTYLRTAEGKGVMDQILFKTPVFGEIMKKAAVARFSRTMGTLLSSGVNLLEAIDVCKATVDNSVLEKAMAHVREDVEAGKSVSSALSRIEIFPRMAVQMVAVGESTGNLETMLDRIADLYEADVETMVGGLSKLMEPILIVVLGSIVGGIMIAMYLPIFKLGGGFE